MEALASAGPEVGGAAQQRSLGVFLRIIGVSRRFEVRVLFDPRVGKPIKERRTRFQNHGTDTVFDE
jgi:hypothetical protein